MEKDYVLDHDWGSYEKDSTINKLMLRNTDDFMKYFDNEMTNNPQYNAEIVVRQRYNCYFCTVKVMFQPMKHTFQPMKRTFQQMKHTFQRLEQRLYR